MERIKVDDVRIDPQTSSGSLEHKLSGSMLIE